LGVDSGGSIVMVDVTGDNGSTKMFYDGETLVAYNPDEKKYSSIHVPGKLDEMVDAAEKRLGADFPLADLLTDNPEKSIISGVVFGRPGRGGDD
jgi:hypothetical protein